MPQRKAARVIAALLGAAAVLLALLQLKGRDLDAAEEQRKAYDAKFGDEPGR